MKIGGLLLLALPACCILLTVVTAGTHAAIGAGIIVYILWRWRGARARRARPIGRDSTL